MRKIRKSFLFILILFISIGFAVLTANLNLNSVLSFRQNTFDVHIETPSVNSSSTTINSNVSLTNTTTLSFSTTYTKPGEALDIMFYIVNDGTIDASISSITTTLTSEQSEYITYRFNYASDNSLVNNNDVIYAGQARKIIGHFEYKYDIDNLINLDNFSTSITFNFVQDHSSINNVWAYEYVGDYQTFTAPKTGSYKIELWGSKGGNLNTSLSMGGYTSGKISLSKGQKLYIYVGAFGKAFNYGIQKYSASGGGATDIRLVSGSWSNFDSLKSRIMVAAGGGSRGGTNAWDSGLPAGGSAGGLIGYNGDPFYSSGTNLVNGSDGGTQTSGASFGNVKSCGQSEFFPGGGNGYFTGACPTFSGSGVQSTGGGSSYISGHNGCVAIEESSTENNITFPTKNGVACTDGTTDQDCSVHYSGMEFTDTVMIDGKGYSWTTEKGSEIVGMPKHDGTGTMTGNYGDGYAKITLEDSILCKRATTLHTTTCQNTSGDSSKMCTRPAAGYSTGDTIVYGNIPSSKNYKPGDAFDCDVNGDGAFNSYDERFYYVSDLDSNNNYSVLLYSYPTIGGVKVTNGNINVKYNASNQGYKGPVTAFNELPTASQWSNTRLYNYRVQLKNELSTLVSDTQSLGKFKYTNFTSRFITYQEAYRACNNTTSWKKQCEFLFENTSYDKWGNYSGNWGFWTQTSNSESPAAVCHIDSHTLNLRCGYSATLTNLGVKPVIEVPKNRME
ncbi:MAG: glycine rich domain-containing protein [Bacilli bacterium]|nr:glycine rich domain-containing protein [Bacilli bacterium]